MQITNMSQSCLCTDYWKHLNAGLFSQLIEWHIKSRPYCLLIKWCLPNHANSIIHIVDTKYSGKGMITTPDV